MKAGSVVAATVITSPLFGLRPCKHRGFGCLFQAHELDTVEAQSDFVAKAKVQVPVLGVKGRHDCITAASKACAPAVPLWPAPQRSRSCAQPSRQGESSLLF